MEFTAIIEYGENRWFVGQIKEVPNAIFRGKIIKELKENLTDALKMVLEANQESYICI